MSSLHSSELEESTTFKDVLYQVWRNGRDNLDRYETVEIALEAHKKVIASERQKAVEEAEFQELTEKCKCGHSDHAKYTVSNCRECSCQMFELATNSNKGEAE